MDETGATTQGVAVRPFGAYVKTGVGVSTPADTLIIGGAAGVQYGPSIVGTDRLVGGGKVASKALSSPAPTYMQQNYPGGVRELGNLLPAGGTSVPIQQQAGVAAINALANFGKVMGIDVSEAQQRVQEQTGAAKGYTYQQSVQPLSEGLVKNLYVPEGKYMQQELSNVKLGVSAPGEYAIYKELPKGFDGQTRYTRDVNTGELTQYQLLGGGGRAAIQSGTVGTAAATKAVYGEGRVGFGDLVQPQVIAPGAMASPLTAGQIAGIAKTKDARDILSGLGAEGYGGVVTRLDNRTLGTITYEDVSNRAAWNLAAYLNPTDVNKSKAELPGANIPWSISGKQPAIFMMDETGATTQGVAVRPFGAYVKTGKEVSAPANTLIIGGAAGVRYGPSIVGTDRLVGGGKVASVPQTTQTLPSPFVSGTEIKPTGEIGIPFTETKVRIPYVSDLLSYVSPSAFVSGRASSVEEINPKKTGGIDYANVFIQPETNKPTRTLIERVGEPKVTTAYNPATGVFEATATQDLKATTLPETKTVYTFTGTERKSAYDKMLDENFRKYIPDVETGEKALEISQLFNPLNQRESISGVVSRSLVYGAADRLGIDTTELKRAGDYVTALTSPTKGQYQLLYERPETMPVSYALGGVFGAGTRGLGAVAARSEVLTKAAPAISRIANVVLPAAYGASITYESTGGLKELAPENIAAIRARATQEIYPMAKGFGVGYALPEIAGAGKPTITSISRTMAGESATTTELMKPSYIDIIKSNLPTYTGLKAKYIEARTPGTAMSAPAAAERYVKTGAERSTYRYGTTSRENPSLARNRANTEFYRERLQSRPSSQMSAKDPMLKVMGEQPRESRIGVTAMGGKSEITGFLVQESPLIAMRDVARTGQSKIAGMLAQYQKAPPVKTPYTGVETKTPGGVLASKVESISVSEPAQTTKLEAGFKPLQQRSRLKYLEQEQVYYRVPEGMTRPAPQESTASLIRMQPDMLIKVVPMSALASGTMQLQETKRGLQNVLSTKSKEIGLAVETGLSRTRISNQRSRTGQEQRSGISEDQVSKTSVGVLTAQKQATALDKTLERTVGTTGVSRLSQSFQITVPTRLTTTDRITTTITGKVPPPPPPPVPPLGFAFPSWGTPSGVGRRGMPRKYTEVLGFEYARTKPIRKGKSPFARRGVI